MLHDLLKSSLTRARRTSVGRFSLRSLFPAACLVVLAATSVPAQALTWHFGYVYNDDAAKKAEITAVMNEAVAVYNATTNINVDINVAYHPGVPTAEASYNGELKFGGSISTQVAIHEIAHYLGSGTTWQWEAQFGGDNVWDGAALRNFVKNFDGPGGEIYRSGVHYYPYGFNYGNEDNPEARRRIPRLIEAMRFDMGFQDGDGDGMSDEWEIFRMGGMAHGAAGDFDGDGISNRDEWLTEGDPVRAAPVRHGHTYLVRARHSQKLMEVDGMGAGANVRQNTASNSDLQKWTAYHVGGGYWKFLNFASGKALETGGLSNNAGANVMVWDDLGHDYQQWRLVPGAAGHAKMFNKGSRNMVVDVDGGPGATGNLVNISQYYDVFGGTNQEWMFEDVTTGEPTGALLQAVYKLDGSPRDSSGCEYHGTATAGVSYGAGRVDAQGANFNGANGSIQIPVAVDTTFSIACWFKTTATAGGTQWYNGMGLVDGEVGGVTADFGLALVGNKIGFGVGNPDATLLTTQAVNDGQWHHVVVTRDGSSGAIQIYLDGVQRATGTGALGARTAPGSLRLGSIGGVTGFLNGSLDEVRLYRGVLSQSEISRLAGVGRTQVAGYAFENNTRDASQHRNHGQSHNVTYGPGKTGAYAAQFNGTDSFVKIPASGVTDFSVAYWVKTTATGGAGPWWAGKAMIDGEVPGVANDWGIALVGAKAAFGAGNPDLTLASTTSINDGGWHHIIATRTGAGAMKLYVDGMLEASAAGPAAARTATGFLRVGSAQYGGAYFAGTIDDLRVYNYAVDASQAAALASTLPAPWMGADVGTPGSDGFAGWDGATYTVGGAGSGIAGSSDQFQFVSSPLSGDRVLTARLLSPAVNHDGSTTTDARAGLMLRASSAANSAFVALVHTQTKGLQFLHRDAAGQSISQTGADLSLAAPCWLRLIRTGDVVAAFYAVTPSEPGAGDWIALGHHATAIGTSASAGLVVTSHSPLKIATATFASLASAANTPPTLTAPADQVIAEDTATPVLPVTLGDAESPASSLVLSASSSNPSLVPTVNIALGGSGTARTVMVTPVADRAGSAVITLSVSDGGPAVTVAFTVTVQTTPGGAWRQEHFGSTAADGDAADAADPDHDGIVNLLERALALDPHAPDSGTALPAFSKEAGDLVLTYTKSLAATDLVYQVTWSDDLGEWSEEGVTDSLIESDGVTERRAGRVPLSQVGGDKGFLRLQVTP